MSPDPDRLVSAVIARLVAGDPLAPMLIAAAARDYPESFEAAAAFALAVDCSSQSIDRAQCLATTRKDRQHVAILGCWLAGDQDRVWVLAREHLSSFPEDVVISWLAGQL
jgi:hypothetical protein